MIESTRSIAMIVYPVRIDELSLALAVTTTLFTYDTERS